MDEVKFAGIPGGEIAYRTIGSGEPLILCIGFASTMDYWSGPVLETLSKAHRVIIFDYRGMGLSKNQSGPFSIYSLAEDLSEFMSVAGIPRATILGWSMGGFVAQMFAIHHPEKVGKLILYASNCGDTVTVNPTDEIVGILSNPSSTPAELLGTLFPADWMAAHPEPWKVMPEVTEPANPETIGLQYMAIQQWLSPGGGSAGLLNKLTMPVLIICGEEDDVVPCINSSLLAEAIPASRLVKIKDTGHGLMYQDPGAFTGQVLKFLAS